MLKVSEVSRVHVAGPLLMPKAVRKLKGVCFHRLIARHACEEQVPHVAASLVKKRSIRLQLAPGSRGGVSEHDRHKARGRRIVAVAPGRSTPENVFKGHGREHRCHATRGRYWTL